MGLLINIDNGGTLTDIWAMDGERSYHTKTITTPYDLSKCFFEGLKKLSGLIYGHENLVALLQSAQHIRYSTTQGTNALVMKRGPRIGLIVDSAFDLGALQATAGQRDMLTALVGERIGVVSHDLGDKAYEQRMVEVVNRLSSEGANRIVVAFVDDFRRNESRFRRTSLTMFPRHLLGALPMLYAGSLSGVVDPILRCWTALFNAFLHPAMERFLYNTENRMREHRVRRPLLIYRNDGYAGRVAKTVAIKTYSSGPRAGMESARSYAAYYGFSRLLSMDVGGTTTDIGVVENGMIRELPRGEVEGIACSFPLTHIDSIGVGGGSIFRVVDGRMTVGPDSVGGAPGPACFALGGTDATITDALLVIGLLDPATYFGGEMKLDRERAVAAIKLHIADPLDLSLHQAIYRMLDLWAQSIVSGLQRCTRLDEDLVLTAFGGGGPMGVLSVAEAGGIGRVLIPRLAAVFSAHGIAFSDIAHAAERPLPEHTAAALDRTLLELREQVQRDMFSEGFSLEECQLRAWLALGDTSYPLDQHVPVLPQCLPGDAPVVVHLRAEHGLAHASLPEQRNLSSREPVVRRHREVVGREGEVVLLPVLDAEEQLAGTRGEGPAVIEERFWTCKVNTGWRYEFTSNRDVLLTRQTEVSQ